MDFNALTTTRLSEAFAARESLPAVAAGFAGLEDVHALVRRLAERTACVTMLAGSGSRWVASLEEARIAGKDVGVDPAAPRWSFPVRNVMGLGPNPIPIAGYAMAATRDLGHHVIVVRGREREIEELILRPLSYPNGSWNFVTQEAHGGKPRGHGDAAFQAMDFWSGYDYVLVNFGGDASSPLTAIASLAVLDALAARYGSEAPGLLIPVALARNPVYPITIDDGGLPRRFGHGKLHGSASPVTGNGYTNVGVRVYRASVLREAILDIRRRHWTADSGYAIPGNDPEGGEFALDNVDAVLAVEGRARLLAVASPEELSPVKSLGDVSQFERDVETVWRGRYPNSGLGSAK